MNNKIYSELCRINYNESSAPTEEKQINKLKEYYISEALSKDLENIKGLIEEYNKSKNENEKLHIGVISSGAHSIDYKNYYKENNVGDWSTYDDWIDVPIMYVYECPAANLPDSFWAKKNNYIDKSSSLPQLPEISSDLLCNLIWHLDEINGKWENEMSKRFAFFEKKKYGKFLLSLILNFKLKNFYTTNLFRYEIFRVDSNNKETALNLPDIGKALGNDQIITETFRKEVEIFKPKIILATSNPYWYLKKYKSDLFGSNNPKIVKVPHPASRDSEEARFLKNSMCILNGLKKVLDPSRDYLGELFERFSDLQDNE